MLDVSLLRFSVLVAALAGVAFGASAAHAEPVEVSLDYQLDPGSLACPGAAELRKEITRQLGRNPFREEGAPHRLLVRVFATGSGIGGRVEWRDQNDRWEGERTFSTRRDNCAGMIRALALATAIQIRLLEGQEQAVAPGPMAESPPLPARTAEVAEAPAVTAVIAEPVSAAPPAPRPPPPRAVASVEEAAPIVAPAAGPAVALEVGAGVVEDTSHGPLFALPRIALSLGQPSALQLRLAASGLGPSTTVSNGAGSARLDRLIVVLGVVHFFRADRLLQPLLSAGIGWQRLQVQGLSAMPDLAAAHDGQVSSGLATVGGGLACTLVRGLSLLVEVEGILFRPSASVEVGAPKTSLNGTAVFARGGLLARF
jgi:hypothetical protein